VRQQVRETVLPEKLCQRGRRGIFIAAITSGLVDDFEIVPMEFLISLPNHVRILNIDNFTTDIAKPFL
jgi:hypothetical protein